MDISDDKMNVYKDLARYCQKQIIILQKIILILNLPCGRKDRIKSCLMITMDLCL